MRRVSLLLLAVILTGCPAARPQVPGASPIDVRGTYVHAPSGFVFPERLGRFERVSVYRYGDSGNSVGVGYNLKLRDSPVAFTLYVRPPGRTEEGMQASFERHFDAELSAIDHYHSDAVRIRREPTSTVQEGRTVPGEMAEFMYSDRFAGRDQQLFSQLYLFSYDNWIVKYRVTFPVSEEPRARAAVQTLLDSLQWRSSTGLGVGAHEEPTPVRSRLG